MRAAALLLLGLALAGCETYDKHYITDYHPRPDGGVDYRVGFGVLDYPPDDPETEAMRLRWLDELMTNGAFCPNGYAVVERRVVWLYPGKSGDIWYRVECRH